MQHHIDQIVKQFRDEVACLENNLIQSLKQLDEEGLLRYLMIPLEMTQDDIEITLKLLPQDQGEFLSKFLELYQGPCLGEPRFKLHLENRSIKFNINF